MSDSLERQAESPYRTFSKLVRRYQFRDREGICCHGISVSQCYALSVLQETGPSTMSELAAALYLDLSTITRPADQLEEKGWVQRTLDEADRRVCRARITRAGRRLVRSIESELIDEYREVLRKIPTASRESVLSAMEGLLVAFEARGVR